MGHPALRFGTVAPGGGGGGGGTVSAGCSIHKASHSAINRREKMKNMPINPSRLRLLDQTVISPHCFNDPIIQLHFAFLSPIRTIIPQLCILLQDHYTFLFSLKKKYHADSP